MVGRIIVVLAAGCLAVLFPLLVYRYLRYPAPPAPLAPTFCIFAAPFSIVLTGYCRCYAEPNTALVLGLWACSLIAYAVVIAHVPRLIRGVAEFSPTLACLTFPFTVSARATLWVGNVIETGGVLIGLLPVARALFGVQLLVALVLLAYVTARFVRRTAGV